MQQLVLNRLPNEDDESTDVLDGKVMAVASTYASELMVGNVGAQRTRSLSVAHTRTCRSIFRVRR